MVAVPGELFVAATVPRRGIDLEFTVPAGAVVALLGANGAGKSTALHVIAGLVRPDAALVRLGDRVLTDTSAGVDVPTHARRIALLMQEALLFPHLDVTANVAFAARGGGTGRRVARAHALGWLREVGADDLADRRPRELSGGQAQRVALARALAAEPEVLLLDEPMAGLDVQVATAMRGVLRRVLTGNRSAVLVTHDVLDAVTLADHVVVLADGRVAEVGPTAAVLSAPRSAFAARLAGLNLVAGTIDSDGVLRTPAGERWHGVAPEPLAAGAAAVAVFTPAAVAVFGEPPKGSPRNVVEVRIAELDSHGAAIRVRSAPGADRLPGIAADVTRDAAADLLLTAGSAVWFAVKAQEVALHAR